jgi:hypothetical protein
MNSLELKGILLMALILLMAAPAWGQAPLSDREYKQMMRDYPEFAAADRDISRIWDSLPATVKRRELPAQRKWIKSGRDQAASTFIRHGSHRAEAYTRATRQRARELMSLTPSRPPLIGAPGPALPPGDSFARADRDLNRLWNDLPSALRGRLRDDQRRWVDSGRAAEARAFQREGFNLDAALALATRNRIEVLRGYANGRYPGGF